MQGAGLVPETPARMTAQACPASLSQATSPRSCWPQERVLAGSSVVQPSSSGYPKCRCPIAQREPSPPSGGLASWQQQREEVRVAGLVTHSTLLTLRCCHRGDSWSWGAGTNATLRSSEFTGNVLHSSGGQRWAGDKNCGAKFSSPTPFACCVCSV